MRKWRSSHHRETVEGPVHHRIGSGIEEHQRGYTAEVLLNDHGSPSFASESGTAHERCIGTRFNNRG